MKLVAVPNLELAESPASWLSRVALSQHVKLTDLLTAWQIPRNVDIDFVFAKRSFDKLANEHTNASGNFKLTTMMLSRLYTVDPHGRKFLLQRNSRATYRFCPQCLEHSRVKFFRIEWRFGCWLWCPEHNCFLENGCWHCGNAITLPVNMRPSGTKYTGVPTLDHCASCGRKLTSNWADRILVLERDNLQKMDRYLLDNGRAVISALFHGHLQIAGSPSYKSLSHLRKMDRLGLIPHRWHQQASAAETGLLRVQNDPQHLFISQS